MRQFKISGFADEAGKTTEEQIKVLRINNIGNIEVRGIDGKNILDLNDAELRRLKNRLDENGIRVSAIGSPIGKTPVQEKFELTGAAFDKALIAAEILDAPYIRAFSFFIPKGGDPMQWADEVVLRLTELVKRAEEKGRRYALENESGIFTDIPDRCAYVLDRVPRLCLAFDPGNFIMNNAGPLEAWKLLKNKVAYFHIKDGTTEPRRNVPAGEGEGYIPEILKDAYNSGFDSYLSVEPHLQHLENLNNAQRFTVAANALKEILNTVFDAGLDIVDLNILYE